jgi:hypothetical protein
MGYGLWVMGYELGLWVRVMGDGLGLGDHKKGSTRDEGHPFFRVKD